MKKGIFTGSFDPFTVGHLDIVKRALPLFDELTICIGFNELKHYDEPVETRMENSMPNTAQPTDSAAEQTTTRL